MRQVIVLYCSRDSVLGCSRLSPCACSSCAIMLAARSHPRAPTTQCGHGDGPERARWRELSDSWRELNDTRNDSTYRMVHFVARHRSVRCSLSTSSDEASFPHASLISEAPIRASGVRCRRAKGGRGACSPKPEGEQAQDEWTTQEKRGESGRQAVNDSAVTPVDSEKVRAEGVARWRHVRVRPNSEWSSKFSSSEEERGAMVQMVNTQDSDS